MVATIVSAQKACKTSASIVADAVWQSVSPIEEDDFTLIRRVVARDRQAFEILYQRYARRLYGYLSKLLQQPEVVEEVLDDIMLVVWQSARRFDYTSRLSTWIFGIAYHKALKARARVSKESTDALPDTPAGRNQDDPERIMTRQELGHTLSQALEALSPEQRTVMELTFYHGCSYQEVAVITKCPVNTVKTRMFHARRRLAQFLAGMGLAVPPGDRRSRHDTTRRRRWAEPHPSEGVGTPSLVCEWHTGRPGTPRRRGAPHKLQHLPGRVSALSRPS
jgi:RNA polymerase sigma factor (sigma-70 family)